MSIDPRDPFLEKVKFTAKTRLDVLGADCEIAGTDARLVNLAVNAFGPRRAPDNRRQRKRLTINLLLTDSPAPWPERAGPPKPYLFSDGGLLCATVDAGNLAIVDIAMSRALICISNSMLRFPYHARYELIEFAALTLASRSQSLVPLHAACLGHGGAGILLMGESGAGKSTLSLHGIATGMRFLSEDSAFVDTSDLDVFGIPTFIHVRRDTLESLDPETLRRKIAGFPVIRRRSGTEKFEVDLRDLEPQLASPRLRLTAIAILSQRSNGQRPLLKPIGSEALLERLRQQQPYAAGMSNWKEFESRILAVPSFELFRGLHPDMSVRALADLLSDPVSR